MVTCCNPRYCTLVEQPGWLKLHQQYNWCGHEFVVYPNRP